MPVFVLAGVVVVEVVEPDHAIAAREQHTRQSAAEEPGRPGDEVGFLLHRPRRDIHHVHAAQREVNLGTRKSLRNWREIFGKKRPWFCGFHELCRFFRTSRPNGATLLRAGFVSPRAHFWTTFSRRLS